jgi:DNA-binding protein H-NS
MTLLVINADLDMSNQIEREFECNRLPWYGVAGCLQQYEVIQVARAIRSIVKLFENLPFEEQTEALTQLLAAHEQSRSAKRAELERQLAELDHDAPKKSRVVVGSQRANGVSKERSKRAAKKNGKTSSVEAKYRDGRTGETWSGRGRMASWLKAKQDAGENIDKYLLN